MAVVVNLKTLTEQVEVQGLRKKEIAELYGLSEYQTTQLLKQAKLKILRKKPGFVLDTSEDVLADTDPQESVESASPELSAHEETKEEVGRWL